MRGCGTPYYVGIGGGSFSCTIIIIVVVVIVVPYGKKGDRAVGMKSLEGGTIHSPIELNRASDSRSSVGDCGGGECTEIFADL